MPDAAAAKGDGAARALLYVAGLGLALRLLRLDLPILEFYSQRQIYVAEIARNLWREGFSGILLPHVYWQGREPVYFVLEFPLYNAVVAGLYTLTGGVREVLGRLVSIAAWSGGAAALHALARRHFGSRAALAALALFAFAPLGVVMSRAFQPEALMLALGLVGMNAFDRWLATGRAALFALAALALSLAVLLKLPMLHLAAPLLALAIGRYGRRTPRVPALWLLVACVLLPAALWYVHAGRVGDPEYSAGNFTIGNWFSAARLTDPHFYKALLQVELDWVLTPVGAALATLGLFLRPVPGTGFVYAWLGGVVAYFLAFNYHSTTHFYYHLPMLPVAALLVGRGWAALTEAGLWQRTLLDRRLAQVLLVGAVGIWAVRPLTYAYRVQGGKVQGVGNKAHVVEAAKAVQEVAPAEALLVAASGAGSDLLYYADRKGWRFVISRESMAGAESDMVRRLETLRARGADFFAVADLRDLEAAERFHAYLRSTYRLVRKEPGYAIFDLRPGSGAREGQVAGSAARLVRKTPAPGGRTP